MKVIITGASGMVGRGVLLECLDNTEVEKVLAIGRTSVGISHPKLHELSPKNFLDYSNYTAELSGYDACYLCMGVSAPGMKEETYFELTYSYTIALAKRFVELNKNSTITYVSGQGTDSTETGRIMWARVKGKTENALLALNPNKTFLFRPGVIIPLRGIKSKTKSYQFFYDYFMWLIRIQKFIAPTTVVNTTQIGLAMLRVALSGYDKNIITPKDILKLAN